MVCGKGGHKLEEITAVVAYRCTRKGCDFHRRVDCISRGSLGRYCLRCEAAGEENIEAKFSGSEHLTYKCLNCGHSWRQLR